MAQNRMEQGDGLPLRERRWREFFDRCDIDHNGSISYYELIQMIDNGDGSEIPPHVVRTVHKRADRNGDGRISYDEFVQMVTHPENEQLFSHHFQIVANASKKYIHYLVPRRNYTQDTTDAQYEEEYRCCPPPFGMLAISIIEIILFIVDEMEGDTRYADGIVAKWMILDPRKRSEAWRFLTYMFVHIGYMHLVVNLMVQLMLGIPLEMVHRWWRVLLIYFAGVIAGSLGTTVFDPTVKLAGASGGVYALITAHIATIFLNWSEMTYPLVQLFIFLIITLVDTGTAIYNRYYLDINEHIGYVAHFAGAIAGLLVGIIVLRNLTVTKAERYAKYISITLYVLLMGTGIIINIAWTDHFRAQKFLS